MFKSKAWLRQKYHVENMSINDIAKQCGVDPMTIRRYLDKFGLFRR